MDKFFELIIGDTEGDYQELSKRYFKDLENLKEYVVSHFMEWYFEEHSVDDLDRYEEIQGALYRFKNAEDYTALNFDEVFEVELQFFDD